MQDDVREHDTLTEMEKEGGQEEIGMSITTKSERISAPHATDS